MAHDSGENGRKPGVLEDIKDKTRELGETLKLKARQQAEELKKPEETQLYRSIFRIKHNDEPRNRALSTLNNLFFHIHPAKVNRDATRYGYTW
ncbi:MAG TPA: hypothetical protein VNF00_03280, partial [Candidatus Acidoferrales bacterium]|nr:hypothetical protein [Candidatus Acidoferrales bacterium]